MFRVNGVNYFNKSRSLKIHFKYSNQYGEKPDRKEVPYSCVCEIEDGDGNWISYGASYCNPNDNFNYSMARKIALTKALKDVFDRSERTKIWEAYKNSGARWWTIRQ